MKKIAAALSATALLALGLVLAPSDPALSEVVFDRNGVAWTQDGERIEADHPLWDCETMGNQHC